jgi:chemotaxis response regulator CheB
MPETHAGNKVMKKKSSAQRQRKKQADAVFQKTKMPPKSKSPAPRVSLPIIGIGASAGGLEALEHFLSHVPKGSGMAFVIV